jgi:hypothetical protein
MTDLWMGAHRKPDISLPGSGAPSVCLPESVIPSAGAGIGRTVFQSVFTGGSFA